MTGGRGLSLENTNPEPSPPSLNVFSSKGPSQRRRGEGTHQRRRKKEGRSPAKPRFKGDKGKSAVLRKGRKVLGKLDEGLVSNQYGDTGSSDFERRGWGVGRHDIGKKNPDPV